MLGSQKVEIKRGGDFDPVPMDRYTVIICDVNLVSQFNQFQGKEEDVLNYQFQILDDKPMPLKEGEDAATTRGRYLWKRCRPALNNRSWLGKLAKAAEGRDLTKEELDSFDPEVIIGKQVDVMVEQAESKDGQKIFNNVISFNKTAIKLEPLSAKEAEEKPATIEKSTTSVPAQAPDAEAESFTKSLEEEGKVEVKEEVEDSVDDLEAKLALAKAKAKQAVKAAAKK